MRRKLTIGALSRASGVPVKTLRFYSNEGLLPPLDRSRSGYRLYAEEHVLRVELIRSLREAGVGLAEIGDLVRRKARLEDVLTLRLRAVEADIEGLSRVASALRLALEVGPTERNLRRISMAIRASNEERRQVVKDFYDKVVAGLPAERGWVDDMIDASTPALPDAPSDQQVAAWMELEDIMGDDQFVACKRASAVDVWSPRIDRDAFLEAQHHALLATAEARGGGLAPSSEQARAIVERFVDALAVSADEPSSVRAHVRTKYDPRGARYWELVAVLRGDADPLRFDDWRWLGQALGHHIEAPLATPAR